MYVNELKSRTLRISKAGKSFSPPNSFNPTFSENFFPEKWAMWGTSPAICWPHDSADFGIGWGRKDGGFSGDDLMIKVQESLFLWYVIWLRKKFNIELGLGWRSLEIPFSMAPSKAPVVILVDCEARRRTQELTLPGRWRPSHPQKKEGRNVEEEIYEGLSNIEICSCLRWHQVMGELLNVAVSAIPDWFKMALWYCKVIGLMQ